MRTILRVALLLLFACATAHADTIKNFTLASDLSNGYSAQGLIAIDTTDGQVQSSFFTLSQGGLVDATFTQPSYAQAIDNVYLAQFSDAKSGYTYELLLPNASLVGFGGGSVCTTTHTCLGYPSGVYLPGGGSAVALDGTLEPVSSATPEPTSLLLLGTGILLTTWLRRRRTVAGKSAAEGR